MINNKAVKTEILAGGLGWSVVDDREIEAVTALLKNPDRLFRYQGAQKGQSDMLEQELREKLDVPNALFISSGTAALTCCLSAFEIGPGDEVIVPGYTYIATASAVIDVGAVPVIAEIDNSLGLDPVDVEKKITPYTKAIIAVNMQGVPCKLDELRALAKKYNLYIIEDCCQAIGSTYKGKHCGVESDAFAWSTNFYKVLTCGEGGVFFAKNPQAFKRGLFQSDPAMDMWSTAIEGDTTVKAFARGGFRGNEISAAMLRVQLTKLDSILEKTRSLKKTLIKHLNTPKNYTLQHVDDVEGDCGFSFSMIVCTKELAKAFSEELLVEGLGIGSVYNHGFPDRHVYSYWDSIIYKQSATPAGYPWKDPAYKGNVEYSVDMCPNTLDILARCLRLSIHVNMTEQNMIEFADAMNKVDARL